MKTFLTTMAVAALLSPVCLGADEIEVGTFDVEIGLLDENSDVMHVTFYGNRDADPRDLLDENDKSVAVGDFNRDGFEDVAFFQTLETVVADKGDGVDGIITGAGVGGGPHVKVFNTHSGFTGGVRVASGDVTGDGTPDIITAPGFGGGPHIKVFDAYPGFTGGVRVAVGDVTGDGTADIIVGADAGGGPHVKVFSTSTGFKGGVNVGAGDITGDGTPDLVTVPGPGGGPHVRVFSGAY